MRVIRYNLGPLDNNTYLVVDEPGGEAAIVDPSFDSRKIWDDVRANGWRLSWVLNTHAHLDHIVENAYFVAESGAPLALHPADLPLMEAAPTQAVWISVPPPAVVQPSHLFTDGEAVAIGSGVLRVAHTPGHSPGSVSLVGPGLVIVGDVLFQGSVGRTDLPGGDGAVLLESIRTHLLTLPDDTRVLPGHGDETTIGEERRSNPFLLGIADAR